MTYYCDKCKRNHVRGSIHEEHQIYSSENRIEITEEIKNNPWKETCHDCKHGSGGSWTSCDYLNLKGYQPENTTLEISMYVDGRIGGSIPKGCFRAPRNCDFYRKCKYWEER